MFVRAVPPEFVQGVIAGVYKVTGSVVRDVATGKGVAFLQETGVLQTLLNSVMSSGGNPVMAFANLALGGVSVVQNQQIKSRLAEVQSSLALLQNLQIGTLAVSGLGLGVSVVGFAAMLKRLKGIENHLHSIDAKIDRVTTERREDSVRTVFADIGTHLEAVDTLSLRTNKVAMAEATEQALARSAGRLEMAFQDKSAVMQTGTASLADLDMLWSLAAAIRLCHEAGNRALYAIDELQAAGELSERRAARFLSISNGLSPDTLARLCSQGAKDAPAYAAARQQALPQAEALIHGLRESVATIGSQAELSATLVAKGISGPAYLAEVADEKEAPLLLLEKD